jgi:F420 biosynthesis protein FbiB-like protein
MEIPNDHGKRNNVIPRERARSFLRGRRSVRKFRPGAVPEEVLARMLEAATWAPSAHNRQPWRFAVLSSQQARVRLADAMGADFRRDSLVDELPALEAEARVARSRARMLEAPIVVLLCLDISCGDSYPDPVRQAAEYRMGVQGVALAGGYLLLAAHAEGLGGVWTCAPLFAQDAARQALDLPAEWQPQALLLLGYPAEIPPPRPRRPIDEIALFY